MAKLYTQDSTPTNPFGIGWHEQAVATSERLIREREAKEAQLLPQINEGPYAFSSVRTARRTYEALAADPNADPAAVATAKATYDNLQATRDDLIAEYEQNNQLLQRTRDGLIDNQDRLAQAQAKAAGQPADRVIVNAGNDPAANSTPPVVSPTNITGTEPPLNVTTPAANSPQAVADPLADPTGEIAPPVEAAQPVSPELADPTAVAPDPLADPTADIAFPAPVPSELADPTAVPPDPLADPTADIAFPAPVPSELADPTADIAPPQLPDADTAADREDADMGRAMNALGTALRGQATSRQREGQNYGYDWRVKLQLAPGATYLYKAQNPGILAPLAASNGVIFPYMPTIGTSYNAKYDSTELTHSNYRGYFYKNSAVENINIAGTFTAQNTAEALYLLAVIHFFRSATKMFYGQDRERGTPPPVVYLQGLGEYQFNNHPCLLSTFNYQLPNGVDYIRTQASNQNLALDRQRQNASQFSQLFAGTGLDTVSSRIGTLTNLLTGRPVGQGGASASNNGDLGVSIVNNTSAATYVPTKMEINITLMPLQTRKQQSQQFSLKSFANGDLLKRGFW